MWSESIFLSFLQPLEKTETIPSLWATQKQAPGCIGAQAKFANPFSRGLARVFERRFLTLSTLDTLGPTMVCCEN